MRGSRGPLYWRGLISIPSWISNKILYKMRNELTYPFPNFNGATIESMSNQIKIKSNQVYCHILQEEVCMSLTIHSLWQQHIEQYQYPNMDSTYNLHVHIVECRHNAVQFTIIGTVMTEISQQTPHILPLWARCGVSIEMIWKKIDRGNTAPHCTCISMG